jgi:tetratricopeptide (TPR) repeat protein
MELEGRYEIERKIDLYISGRLTQPQIDNLWVEMIEYPEMLSYLKTSASIKDLVSGTQGSINSDSVSTIVPVTPIKTVANLRTFMAAALLLIAMGLGSLYYMSSSEVDINRVYGPLETLELIAYRSASSPEVDEARRQLNDAVDLALSGNTPLALQLLVQITESTSTDDLKAEANMNIGIIEYNNQEFAEAIVSFKQSLSLNHSNPQLYERAMWNLSHSHMAVGNTVEAKVSLQHVIDLDGAHSRAARNYLSILK